jgi:predicted lipoprotein with Yx(FWY)xxD motif
MRRRRPITFLATAAVIPLTALAVAACGGSGGAATASPAPAPSTSQQTATLRVANSRLGSILVNSNGRTLYLFKADIGTKTACTGACATAWPPLRATGKPTAGTGLTASKLGTTTRSDGTQQVTYNGHPLYLFVKDQKPSQTTGQGVTAFGAAWFAVSPAGNQISSGPAGPAAPAAPPAAKPQPAAPQPAGPPAAKPAPPAAKPASPASSGIPQNGGGDGDSDNNGGPSDGDGNV